MGINLSDYSWVTLGKRETDENMNLMLSAFFKVLHSLFTDRDKTLECFKQREIVFR